jgi:hypothetical protein
MEVRHGGSATWGFRSLSAAQLGEEDEGRRAGPTASGCCGDLRWCNPYRDGEDRRRRLQIIRDWVVRFNARGPDGLLDGKSPGQPSKLNDARRQAIVRMIESGPILQSMAWSRWRLIDLAQWVFEEFRIRTQLGHAGANSLFCFKAVLPWRKER